MHLCAHKSINKYIEVLLNMHLRKLLTDSLITSILYFEKLRLMPGVLAFHLQLKITKITMIHTFYLQLHQKQALRLLFILTLYLFLH